MQDDQAGQASPRTAVAAHDTNRRKAVLIRLQDSPEAEGFESVLVGRRTLVMRSRCPGQLSTPGEPELHVVGTIPCHVVTTDGQLYRFGDHSTHPADDPAGAVRHVSPADADHGQTGPQAPAPADGDAAGRGGIPAGAGERALRRLCDDGVI